jgi:hypothetical protein
MELHNLTILLILRILIPPKQTQTLFVGLQYETHIMPLLVESNVKYSLYYTFLRYFNSLYVLLLLCHFNPFYIPLLLCHSICFYTQGVLHTDSFVRYIF